MTQCRFHSFNFDFPAHETPPWSNRVDRWYQLDPYAYGLASLGWQLNGRIQFPQQIMLASPGASNESDWQFASTGATSAIKFAQTLPNVRISAFCQVTGWVGPVLCIQKDPFSFGTALTQAVDIFDESTMVLAAFCRDSVLDPGTKRYSAVALEICDASQKRSTEFSIAHLSEFDLSFEDLRLFSEFEKRFSHR